MKKIMLTIALAVAIAGCSQTQNVCGTYSGVLPAADGPGIDMTLQLNYNKTFTNKQVYIGRKDATFYEKGTYQWDGELLQLKGDNELSYYKAEPGQLRLLDYEKNEITGALANNYILKKTQDCNEK